MNLGLGVMINLLCGNEDTVNALKTSIGKRIEKLQLQDNVLRLHFKDGAILSIEDAGQSCCEHRYMSTGDDLSTFADSDFMNAEIAQGPDEPDQYGEHEVQFLNITTSKGVAQFANHNEHNGYYGGFSIRASLS